MNAREKLDLIEYAQTVRNVAENVQTLAENHPTGGLERVALYGIAEDLRDAASRTLDLTKEDEE